MAWRENTNALSWFASEYYGFFGKLNAKAHAHIELIFTKAEALHSDNRSMDGFGLLAALILRVGHTVAGEPTLPGSWIKEAVISALRTASPLNDQECDPYLKPEAFSAKAVHILSGRELRSGKQAVEWALERGWIKRAGRSGLRVTPKGLEALDAAESPPKPSTAARLAWDAEAKDEAIYTISKSLDQWATEYKKSKNTLSRWFRNGEIRAKKIGRQWAVDERDLPS